MKKFEYFEPSTINEASSLLLKYGEEAKIIAGGTDLLPDMKRYLIAPKYLISIESIPGLEYINYDSKQGLSIGALTTIRALEKSSVLREKYPIISQTASEFGNFAIRNIGTIGGNLCHALPSADTAPGLIGLSARVKIAGPDGARVVPLEDFFTGLETTILKTGEILVEVQVPVPAPNTKGVYMKYTVRAKCDLPVVGVAVVITLEPQDHVCKDIKIVLGNVAPTPIRARSAEGLIKGQKVNEDIIDKCAQMASDDANPRPGSIRASGEYKKAMIKVFTKRAIKELIA